jgi:hypothetical protein
MQYKEVMESGATAKYQCKSTVSIAKSAILHSLIQYLLSPILFSPQGRDKLLFLKIIDLPVLLRGEMI